VNELVLDASVLVKWFKEEHEAGVEAARALEAQYTRGELTITVPPLLFLELINIAARRWRWAGAALESLAEQMAAFGFHIVQPPLTRIAHWAGLGLTAYDACYVALAEQRRVQLVTADDRILAVAGHLARPLSAVS
jgi:predicted nucleic acid-binding protein